MSEYKEGPKDVQPSLGAHTYRQRCSKNETCAKSIKQGITGKSGQNLLPGTKTRKGEAVSHVTSEGQVAVMAKCSRQSRCLQVSALWVVVPQIALGQESYTSQVCGIKTHGKWTGQFPIGVSSTPRSSQFWPRDTQLPIVQMGVLQCQTRSGSNTSESVQGSS